MRERSSQVLVRLVSVAHVAKMWDVSESFVRRLEAEGFFGVGNSGVLKARGKKAGELRLRVRAVNAAMERLFTPSQRELDRAEASARFLDSHPSHPSAEVPSRCFSRPAPFLGMSGRAELTRGEAEGVRHG